jgi:tetratricopeptide (TPR) repeat protein
LNRARLNRQANNWSQSLSDLDLVLKSDATSAEAHYLRADILLARANPNDIQTAFSDLTTAIGSSPNWPEAHKRLGDAYFQLRDYAHAMPEYKLALDAKPDWQDVLYAHGRTAYTLALADPSNFGVAIGDMRQVLVKHTDFGAACTLGLAYAGRGLLLQGQDQIDAYESSLEAFLQAEKLQPNSRAATRATRIRLYISKAKADNKKGGGFDGVAFGAGLLVKSAKINPGRETLDPVKACDE